jgi:hypothetical protein
MKFKLLTVLFVVICGLAACNSDKRNGGDNDSLMTDSAVMDTATMGMGTQDTAMVDTSVQDHTNTDTIPPIR